MTHWKEWELSAEWSSKKECPDCGHSLIITELIAAGEYEDVHNGICIHCRKQYTTITAHDTLAVNVDATEQQDRIDALEERVTRLEAMVNTLTERENLNAPVTPKTTPEVSTPLLKKYSFLLG